LKKGKLKFIEGRKSATDDKESVTVGTCNGLQRLVVFENHAKSVTVDGQSVTDTSSNHPPKNFHQSVTDGEKSVTDAPFFFFRIFFFIDKISVTD
jgi:hypothetical protein